MTNERLEVLELAPLYRLRGQRHAEVDAPLPPLNSWESFDAWLGQHSSAVAPRGSRTARLVLVSHSPLTETSAELLLLRNILAAIGLRLHQDTWLTAYDKHLAASPAMTSVSATWLLEQELRLIAPAALLVLGTETADALQVANHACKGTVPAFAGIPCYLVASLPDVLATPALKPQVWQQLCQLFPVIQPS